MRSVWLSRQAGPSGDTQTSAHTSHSGYGATGCGGGSAAGCDNRDSDSDVPENALSGFTCFFGHRLADRKALSRSGQPALRSRRRVPRPLPMRSGTRNSSLQPPQRTSLPSISAGTTRTLRHLGFGQRCFLVPMRACTPPSVPCSLYIVTGTSALEYPRCRDADFLASARRYSPTRSIWPPRPPIFRSIRS